MYFDDRPATYHLENFEWRYIRNVLPDPLHVWFYERVFGVGGSNDAISGLTTYNRNIGENNARKIIRLVTIKAFLVFLRIASQLPDSLAYIGDVSDSVKPPITLLFSLCICVHVLLCVCLLFCFISAIEVFFDE